MNGGDIETAAARAKTLLVHSATLPSLDGALGDAILAAVESNVDIIQRECQKCGASEPSVLTNDAQHQKNDTKL